jgi:type II secretion system protein N
VINLPDLLERLPEIPPRYRKPALYGAWALFFCAISAITLFSSLPRDRVKDRIEFTLAQDPMSGVPGAMGADVTIGELGLTLFTGAGITAKDVTVRTRPQDPNAKPVRYVIDDVTVHVGVLGLLFNRPTYTFKAHALQGTVTGEIGLSPSEERIKIDASGIVLTGQPSVAQSVGLPVEGTLGIKVDAVAAKQLAQNLEGTAELTIDGAVIGDGKAKLTVPGDAFLAQGLTFPKLKLGNLNVRIQMTKGRANIEDFRVHSADGDATLEGYADLRDPLMTSTMHGYLKFRASEALTKREPMLELMNNAMTMAKRSDGFIGFQLSGLLSAVYYLPNQNPPPGVQSKSTPPPTAPSTPPPTTASSPPPIVPPPSPTAARMPQPPGEPVETRNDEAPPPPPSTATAVPAGSPSPSAAPVIPVGGSPAGTGATVPPPPPSNLRGSVLHNVEESGAGGTGPAENKTE